MGWLETGSIDPAVWALFGLIISGITAILVEQIRGRIATKSVKREVVDTKDTTSIGLDALAHEVSKLNTRMDEHIKWHLEESRGRYVYLEQPRYRG